jgi:hypothetical protein
MAVNMTRRGDADKPKGRQRPIGVIRDIEPYRAVASDIACGGKPPIVEVGSESKPTRSDAESPREVDIIDNRPIIAGRRQHREFLRRNDYVEVGNESKPTPSDAESAREAQRDIVENIRRAMGDFGSNTGARPAPIALTPAPAVDDDAIKILIQNERTLRKRLHPHPPSRELLRDWWIAVGALLYGLSKEMKPRSAPSTPQELFFILGELATCLGGGHIHEMIMDVGGRGQHPIGPAEKRHIQIAVTYREAVKLGRVDDPHPAESIMKMYGLRSPRTVQEWCAKYPPLPELLKFPESLPRRMQEAGRNYREENRHTQDRFTPKS